jgi:plastocyanin
LHKFQEGQDVRSWEQWLIFGYVLSSLALDGSLARAQGAEVSAQVQLQAKSLADAGRKKDSSNSADVVVWLTPLQLDAAHPMAVGRAGPFRLTQKGKQFTPHMLIVPTGSSVEFPNQDPFFHNVFSLFNGKRFDLGLYESGTSRYVRFDREGVSYVFCNIHPEMGAVVLSLSTPYYGVSTADGSVVIHGVPPGSYRVHVWSETAELAKPADAQEIVQVGAAQVNLGKIAMQSTANPLEHHKNKFGEDYRPSHDAAY